MLSLIITKQNWDINSCNGSYRVCIKSNEIYFILTRLYFATLLLHAGSIEAEASFNTRRLQVTKELSRSSHRGFSGSLYLWSVEVQKYNDLSNSTMPLNYMWDSRNRLESLKGRVNRVKPGIADNWKLHQENATSHTCFVVNDYLTRNGIATLS